MEVEEGGKQARAMALPLMLQIDSRRRRHAAGGWHGVARRTRAEV
jgi:hypothetical protein